MCGSPPPDPAFFDPEGQDTGPSCLRVRSRKPQYE